KILSAQISELTPDKTLLPNNFDLAMLKEYVCLHYLNADNFPPLRMIQYYDSVRDKLLDIQEKEFKQDVCFHFTEQIKSKRKFRYVKRCGDDFHFVAKNGTELVLANGESYDNFIVIVFRGFSASSPAASYRMQEKIKQQ